MERKTKTIDLKGKQYSEVKTRLKEFREDNPRGSVKTTPEFMPDGRIHFTAYILKDKSDEGSADATGHSFGKDTGDKAFEKLETIAVGRALAMLGYGADGSIASSEEMEDFEAHKAEIRGSKKKFWIERIESSETLQSLKNIWAEVPGDLKKELDSVKNKVKEEITKESKPA